MFGRQSRQRRCDPMSVRTACTRCCRVCDGTWNSGKSRTSAVPQPSQRGQPHGGGIRSLAFQLVILHAVREKYNTIHLHISALANLSPLQICQKMLSNQSPLVHCSMALWNVKYIIIELQHSANLAMTLNTYNSCFRCSNENDSGSGWIIGSLQLWRWHLLQARWHLAARRSGG